MVSYYAAEDRRSLTRNVNDKPVSGERLARDRGMRGITKADSTGAGIYEANVFVATQGRRNSHPVGLKVIDEVGETIGICLGLSHISSWGVQGDDRRLIKGQHRCWHAREAFAR